MRPAKTLDQGGGDAVDRVAHALADGTRRALLRLVRDDELPAGDLAAAFPAISRPAVSQHLRVLREAGLVEVRTDGKRRLYSAQPSGLAEMRRYLDDMWADNLQRLKLAAERTDWPSRARQTNGPTEPDPHRPDETRKT